MKSLSSRVRGARLASTPAVLMALVALSIGCAPMARQSVSADITPVTVTSAAAPVRRASAFDHTARAPRHTIARSEFASVPGANTAHDLVMRLRPEFLRGSFRGVAFGSETEPVVYLDALKAGQLSTLRLIPVAQVLDITYVTPVDALLRYGPTHGAGAIVVRTRH